MHTYRKRNFNFPTIALPYALHEVLYSFYHSS